MTGRASATFSRELVVPDVSVLRRAKIVHQLAHSNDRAECEISSSGVLSEWDLWWYSFRTMLKRLMVLAVSLAIWLPLPAAMQVQNRDVQVTAKPKRRAGIRQPTPQPPSGSVPNYNNPATPEGDSHSTPHNVAQSVTVSELPPVMTRGGFDWSTLANCLLVAVGIGGIVVAVATLRKIERQTKAAENSASAALLSAQAFRDTERARMTVLASSLGNLSLQFNARNIGRANAKVIDACGYCAFHSVGETLPQNPIYLEENKSGWDFVEWVGTGADFQLTERKKDGSEAPYLIADLSETAMRNNIQYHGCSMWVFGRIVYFDGISPNERESRYCFRILVDGDGNTRYKTGGPTQYWLET
jgi:hypothetical protein